MTTTTKISDGIYFLHPEGSCWIAVQYRNGRLIDSTEQHNAGSHAAARDDWAGIVPSDDDAEVSGAVADQVIRDAMGDDVHVEMVIVTKQGE